MVILNGHFSIEKVWIGRNIFLLRDKYDLGSKFVWSSTKGFSESVVQRASVIDRSHCMTDRPFLRQVNSDVALHWSSFKLGHF